MIKSRLIDYNCVKSNPNAEKERFIRSKNNNPFIWLD